MVPPVDLQPLIVGGTPQQMFDLGPLEHLDAQQAAGRRGTEIAGRIDSR